MKQRKNIIKIILLVLPICFFVALHQCDIPEQEEAAWEAILFIGLIGIYALECIMLGLGVTIRKIKDTRGHKGT